MIAVHDNHAVEWDGDFKFGVASHDTVYEVEKAAPARAVGAAFLSGQRVASVVHMDENGECEYFNVMGAQVIPAHGHVSELELHQQWTLCGPGVGNPRLVSGICLQTKSYNVSVCPLLGPLAAFGYLVGALTLQGKITPRMTRFCEPHKGSLNAKSKKYDERLDRDGYGRMAHLVQSGFAVVNQIMTTPSIPAFYGRVLSTAKWWGEPIFLMLPDTALKYFPNEPLSVRNYAASWVPVSVDNTSEFSNTSGYGGSVVSIFVASEQTPGLGSFLRFHHMMCKEDFVVSSDPKCVSPIPESIPLFRWGEAYNIGKQLFREVVLNES